MLRSVGWLGLLAVVWLWLAPGPAAAEATAPDGRSPGLGRLWSPPPDLPDPSGEIAGHQLRRNLVNVTKLALALAGTGLLAWGIWLRRTGRAEAHRAARDALLAALGFAGFCGWWNFLYLHYPGALHTNNFYVYYIGAKYFPELGYARLYECTAVADLRGGLRERVLAREMTNLETYQLEGTREIVANPERCTAHFSPERWAAFEADVGWFRSRIDSEEWEDMQTDHGYNPPPSWGLLGTPLAGLAPAGTFQVVALMLLDSLLDLVMWACVWWAFGWRALCVALLYWGTNHTAEFSWTGGSFLRDDWLAASVVGLCLLRRGRPLGAGFFIGYAALLRVFPVLALLGVGLAALLRMASERRFALRAEHRRLALGALLAVAVVVPLSSVVAGGTSSWTGFVENTRLHLGTPATNLVGLETVLSYDPAGRLSELLGVAADPSAAWKHARSETFEARRWIHWLGVLAYLVLLARALVRQEDWVAAILGLGAMLVVIEPTCYYTSILLAFGLLWTRREGIGVALLALSCVQWAVASRFHAWDEIFTWQSLALVAFVVFASAAARLPSRTGD